jgi:hypothetical protein
LIVESCRAPSSWSGAGPSPISAVLRLPLCAALRWGLGTWGVEELTSWASLSPGHHLIILQQSWTPWRPIHACESSNSSSLCFKGMGKKYELRESHGRIRTRLEISACGCLMALWRRGNGIRARSLHHDTGIRSLWWPKNGKCLRHLIQVGF